MNQRIIEQLRAIANRLTTLSRQVDKIAEQLDKTHKLPSKPVQVRPARAKAQKAKIIKLSKMVGMPEVKKSSPGRKQAKGTVLDSVYDVIKKAKNGANIATLKKKTKLEPRQLSNALFRLTKKGAIVSHNRGVYIKKNSGAGGGRPKK